MYPYATTTQCLPANTCILCDPSPDPLLFYPALGKAIQCLAKIGDELYIEAETDGVSSHASESSLLTTSLAQPDPNAQVH